MTNVFNTCGVDLDQFLGTHNDTIRVVVEDKDLITHIKGIIGPFVLKCLKSDLMRQLVLKIQYLFLILSLFLSRSKLDVFL
jgi:SWI/SNF-related matrix-associated actin-dependent regulator 1 of chromatin subfamily A